MMNGQRAMEVDGYRIEFRHEKGEFVQFCIRKGKEFRIICKHRTTCYILNADTPRQAGEPAMFIVRGHAHCSDQDNFDHEVGRQVALWEALKALRDVPAPRPKARRIFAAYTKRPGGLPWILDAEGHANLEKLELARKIRKNFNHQQRQLGRLALAGPWPAVMGALPPGWPKVE